MSVNREEVKHLLAASAVIEGEMIEAAELKAIRESLLQVRMSTWLLLPKEEFWLRSLLVTFIEILRDLWVEGADISAVRAHSDWLLKQVDVRAWAHCLGEAGGENIVKSAPGRHIMLLLSPPPNDSAEIKGEYWGWLEKTLLTPIKAEDPDLYSWLLTRCRHWIAEMVNSDPVEGYEDLQSSPDFKVVVAQAALEYLPPSIRKSLLADSSLGEQYGFTAVLTLGDSELTVQQSVLFDAVRSVLSDVPEVEIIDASGQAWILRNNDGEEMPFLSLCRGERRLRLSNFSLLSLDREGRLRSLENASLGVNFPADARAVWHRILSNRSLTDDEFAALQGELRDTPVVMARSLVEESSERGHLSISSLVPESRRYFENLVGKYDGSNSVGAYAVGSGRALFQGLSAWRAYEGFLYSLFLSSHSAMTAEIDVDLLSAEDLRRAFEFLVEYGDRVSQVGAIEVGLRVLSFRPEIEPTLIRLIERVRDDDVDAEASGFQFLLTLFVLVDGELSRSRLFAADPPFYRRLTALAQAALIHRQFLRSGIEIDRFSEWVMGNRGQVYYLQSLTDVRTEPLWAPDLASAAQFKVEFLSRIRNAVNTYEGGVLGRELHELVLGTESCPSKFPDVSLDFYLPGPLDGSGHTSNVMPSKIYEAIEMQLGSGQMEPSSFFALVNSSLIFPLNREQAALAAKALKSASHRFASIEDKSQLLSVLRGLATVSAVARSAELAEELRVLVRRYRQDPEYSLAVEETMEIGLIAAACHSDLKDWVAFVGDWLTELALADLADKEGQILRSISKCLCRVIPELWITCGRAIAALDAFNGRRGTRGPPAVG